MEYRIAEALAVKVITQKAFYPIGEQQLTEAKKWIDACAGCICLLDTFGPLNEACRELQSYAEQCGKLRQVEEVLIEG